MLHFATWKIIAVIMLCIMGILTALPNMIPDTINRALPPFLPKNTINLGLDLQGGSHVLLQVDQKDLITNIIKQMRGDTRQFLREAKIGYRGLRVQDEKLQLSLRNPEDTKKALETLRQLNQNAQSVNGLQSAGQEAVTITPDQQGRLNIEITQDGLNARIRHAIEQSIEIVRRRIDALGTTEPIIQRQGASRILVQVPGLNDPQRLKQLLGRTAKLTLQLLCNEQPEGNQNNFRPQSGCELLPEKDGVRQFSLHTASRNIVEGQNLIDANPGFTQQGNEPAVFFRLDQTGAQRFARITRDNVGRPFAIVLDGEVISAPVIQSPILGGNAQITGNFSVDETNDLAIVLRSGALPAKLVIAEERTVGPSLGADSIAAGKIAGLIGLTGVVIFIIAAYGFFGFVANIALGVNVILIVGGLSFIQATLTLPGIAGIILTMGMAVDANVLIFERIKEEKRLGKSIVNAITAGYERALATILDANITTFIAAILLFGLGSGPIRGFAITLGIGIITSVFTAFTLSRMIVALWLSKFRPKKMPI